MRTRVTCDFAHVAGTSLVGALLSTTTLIGVTGGPHEAALLATTLLGAALLVASSGRLHTTGRRARLALPTPTPGRGYSGHVEAPSAYWCAVRVSARPRLPRAPGRR